MSKPYFSIVTPVFNRPQFLEQTIKSVLSQQFKNYEYIIVDGASKEKTLTIINNTTILITAKYINFFLYIYNLCVYFF